LADDTKRQRGVKVIANLYRVRRLRMSGSVSPAQVMPYYVHREKYDLTFVNNGMVALHVTYL